MPKRGNLLKSGIYCITNLVNGKFYIGSTNCIRARWENHRSQLRRSIHGNSYLQRVYNKYGLENLKFEILAECPSEDLTKLEQWFLDNLKPEYNILKQARGGFRGMNHTEEAKRKISQTLKGHPIPERLIELNNKKAKKVYQYDLEGNFIKIWDSVRSAGQFFRNKGANITKCCKGERQTAHGFKWSFNLTTNND